MGRSGAESGGFHSEEVFSTTVKLHGNTKLWWEEKGISLPPYSHESAITPNENALLQYIVNRGDLNIKKIAGEIDLAEQTVKNAL